MKIKEMRSMVEKEKEVICEGEESEKERKIRVREYGSSS